MQVFVGVLIYYLTILLYYSIIFAFLQGDIANITDCFLECRENEKNHRLLRWSFIFAYPFKIDPYRKFFEIDPWFLVRG